MGKAKRKAKSNQADQNRPKMPPPPRYDGPAKIGPRMVLAEEEFAEPGTADSKKRLRNHGEHPLTLAFHRGQLETKYAADVRDQDRITAHERLAAGEEYRANYERMGRSGRDSTDMSGGSGGGSGMPWTQAQVTSILWVRTIENRMHHRDKAVIRHFCGEGFSMVQALRGARIDVHPSSVAYRIREALDELVAATTGRRGVNARKNVG